MTGTENKTATLLVEGYGQLEPREVTRDCTIGRDPRSGIAIDHPTVSRAHARIVFANDKWVLQDLGSQNGSAINGSRVHGEAKLAEGAELHIGRVRAWFFAGDVPSGWQPDDVPQLAGKLVRCRCGHIGWAPRYAQGMTLTCVACGRDIVVSGNEAGQTTTAAPVPEALQTCAACHTEIRAGETAHACPECAATMHADCWRENHGCATYGCSQVNLEQFEENAPGMEAKTPATVETVAANRNDPHAGERARLRPSWIPGLVQVALVTIVGLPTFGVPGIAMGAYRLVAGDEENEGPRRYAWIALGFAAGAVGFTVSVWWWFER